MKFLNNIVFSFTDIGEREKDSTVYHRPKCQKIINHLQRNYPFS